jgi:hypothetical protein
LKKRTIILSLTPVIVLICGWGLIKLNKDYTIFWDANYVTVTADTPLTTDNIKIKFGVSLNGCIRRHLGLSDCRYTVVYDNGLRDKIPNEYGENDYLLTYADEYHLPFRHFKTYRRSQHNYKFHFSQENNEIYAKVIIDGQEGFEFEKPLIRMDLAEVSVKNLSRF